jgi:ribonuclease HI
MADKALSLFTDGACRGNPGQGGAGAVLLGENGEVLGTAKKFLGHCTNNIAEYRALILGLETALEHGTSVISIYLDSELLVRQIQGIYRVKNPDLKPLMVKIRDLLDRFDTWNIEHVPRSENAMADGLANEAIDEALKKKQ